MIIYIVSTSEGMVEVRKKLSNVKILVRRVLKDYGFTADLKDNLQSLEELVDIETDDCVEFEIDVGYEERGTLFITKKSV